MRPEIRAYMTNNRRNDPVTRQNVVVPKKIIYKTTPRVAKAKKVTPRSTTTSQNISSPRPQNLTVTEDPAEASKDKAATDDCITSTRPRTAKLRKSPRAASEKGTSETMIPYSKEPNRSTKRFLDQSFNVYSTEKKMSKLKV